MKLKTVLLTGLIVSAVQAFGQEIKGKIIDKSSKEPIEFVNIALYEEGTEKMVKGHTTNLQGQFEFSDVAPGTYTLRISFVGYATVNIPVAITTKKKEVNLGSISLTEDSKVLKEVQVTGQKSQMRFEVDKKVFNVDQNIASAGGSASDALSNIPSVTVDNEGNVSLRNNSAVTIWINGRPSGLSEDNRAQILEQLPAESIETIEVITNPSARFSSEGSAGIINIVMKKEKKMGYYGGFSANADTQGGYGASANINMNYDKWEGFANIGYRRRRMETNGTTERTSFREDPITSNLEESILSQQSKGSGGMGGLFARAGVVYNFSKNDVLSFTGSTMQGNHDRNSTIDYTNTANDIASKWRRESDVNNKHTMYSAQMDYIHTFSKNHDLRFAFEYDYMNRGGDSYYDQIYSDTTIYQIQESPSHRKGFEAQVDYTNTLSDKLKIEAGYKADVNSHRSDAQTWNGKQALPAYEDLSLYNSFVYDENIQAVYGTASGKLGKFSYQAGLRGEYTHYSTSSTGKDQESGNTVAPEKASKSYFDLFPSAFLSYSLPKGNELQLNYTRRINRPRGRQLNSFINITDSANISFGNPLLSPEFSHSLELNYIKNWDNHMLSASLYYRATEDVIQRVSYMQGNSLYTTYDNATNSSRSGMELVGKNRLFGWLDLTTSSNLYYYKVDGFTYKYGESSFTYDGSKDFSWDARMIANIMLPWKVSLQLTGNYTSPIKTAQGKDFEQYWLDAGLRKTFLERRLSVAITGRDLFNSRKMKSYRYGDNFQEYSKMQWGGRQVGFTISYNFGNSSNTKKKNGKTERNTEMMGGDMMED